MAPTAEQAAEAIHEGGHRMWGIGLQGLIQRDCLHISVLNFSGPLLSLLGFTCRQGGPPHVWERGLLGRPRLATPVQKSSFSQSTPISPKKYFDLLYSYPFNQNSSAFTVHKNDHRCFQKFRLPGTTSRNSDSIIRKTT